MGDDVERMVNVRLKGPELAMLEELCRREMRTQSNLIRWLIVREFEGEEPTPSPSLKGGEQAAQAAQAVNVVAVVRDGV